MSEATFDFDELGYLQRLTLQLTIGAAGLPESLLAPHVDFLLQRQNQDGGWSGREGNSDLYYTSFALRSLAILGLLDGPVAERSASFLQSQLSSRQSFVDLMSLIYSHQMIEAASSIDAFREVQVDWATAVSALLAELRRYDGGFAKSIDGKASSTYQTFLIAICMELLDKQIDDPDRAITFLRNQQQDDGGFLEIRVAKRSGVNPTAAAIGALRTMNGLDDEISEDAAEFLLELQADTRSGFPANTRMPMADVLSTFTGLVTLWDLDRLADADLLSAKRYVESMQRDGGFAGFELDPDKDVEYTFYGLGTLALLQAEI
jgi:geranylgeranyl transferase type-2 subunit beta